jgi:voltage-gated potassium channel
MLFKAQGGMVAGPCPPRRASLTEPERDDPPLGPIAACTSKPYWRHVNESEGRRTQVVGGESANRPQKVPLTARLLLRDSLTARRAAGIIAGFTLLITVAGGILERLIDHQEFPTIGRGLWFALQTVTTVGYGDVTPKQADGRFIGAVVMLTGIGFLAVITASATASLIEGSRRRFAAQSERDVTRRLEEVSERLARIEAALDQSRDRRS